MKPSSFCIVTLAALCVIGGFFERPPQTAKASTEPLVVDVPEITLPVVFEPEVPAPAPVPDVAGAEVAKYLADFLAESREWVGNQVVDEFNKAQTAGPEVDLSKIVDEVVKPASPPPVDCTVYAYPVRARGYRWFNGRHIAADPPPNCTAISVGKGRFLTAGHLLDGLTGGIEVDIQVEGKWVNKVAFQKAADRDALTITTTLDVPGVEVREPEYREEVVVYGLTTGSPLDGLYCGIMATGKPDSIVSLDPAEHGVIPGDSGGGVFGLDGKLIGLIQGYGAERKNVCTVLVADMEVAEAPKANETPQAPIAISAPKFQSGCPGGICPAPRSTFQQQIAPRRGLFGRKR